MFTVYDASNGLIKYEGPSWKRKEWHSTEGAAKAARTRMIKKGEIKEGQCKIASQEEWATPELKALRTTKVRNLMSGTEVEQDINTPRSCDVSSELYWSM